jgi:hypothetical protein
MHPDVGRDLTRLGQLDRIKINLMVSADREPTSASRSELDKMIGVDLPGMLMLLSGLRTDQLKERQND